MTRVRLSYKQINELADKTISEIKKDSYKNLTINEKKKKNRYLGIPYDHKYHNSDEIDDVGIEGGDAGGVEENRIYEDGEPEEEMEKPQEVLDCLKSLEDANEKLMSAKANVKDSEHKQSLSKLRKKVSRIWDEIVDQYDVVK